MTGRSSVGGLFRNKRLWWGSWSKNVRVSALQLTILKLSSNGFDHSIKYSELLRIEGEWAVDDSHLMNENFRGVAQLSVHGGVVQHG